MKTIVCDEASLDRIGLADRSTLHFVPVSPERARQLANQVACDEGYCGKLLGAVQDATIASLVETELRVSQLGFQGGSFNIEIGDQVLLAMVERVRKQEKIKYYLASKR